MSFAAPTVAFTTTGVVLPEETVAVDFNRDGIADLVTAFAAPSLFAIGTRPQALAGTVAGFFADASTSLFSNVLPGIVNPSGILVADFNRDLFPDLFIPDPGRATGNQFAGEQNDFLLSAPGGFLFNANANLPPLPPMATLSAAAGDVNRDGWPDLYLANGRAFSPVPPLLLINTGGGVLTDGSGGLPAAITDVNARTFPVATFVDVDGNGAADLFLGGDSSTASVLLVNDGFGRFGFAAPGALPPKPFSPDAIATAAYSVNGGVPGQQDIIAVYTRGTPAFTDAAIQILVNRGDGRFADETAQRLVGFVPAPGYVKELQFADFNRDGATDFITEPVDGIAQIFINNGEGYYSRAVNGAISDLPTPFQVGDFTGDRNVDLAAWNNAITPNAVLLYRGDSVFPVRSTGASGNDVLFGTAGADALAGLAGNDVLRAGAGDDSVNGGPGDDFLDGGSGVDTGIYAGNRSLFTIMSSPDSRVAVADGTGVEGIDQLVAVEQASFAGAVAPLVPTVSPLEYIASYPDLMAALGANAQQGFDHFVSTGYAEGRVPTFNGLEYIASYGDLVRAFGANDAAGATHYIVAGFAEGRRPTFDGLEYIASYRDLIAAFGTDRDAGSTHFIETGVREGRSTTFDGLEYVASYGDLIRAFGAAADAGATHYIVQGVNEGRVTTFDGLEYIASYRDLIAAFGADRDAGSVHFIDIGVKEGRGIAFDALRYIASYGDLIVAFAVDGDAGSRHFIGTGVNEGRAITFDPLAYLNKYADLQAAFGSDTEAATVHFITTGYFEGRTA